MRAGRLRFKLHSSSYIPHTSCIYVRAAGAGPVGQAIAGPLLTIIVKYCDSTSFLVDSLPRGAQTMLHQQTECAHGRGFVSARGAAAPHTCPSKSRFRSHQQCSLA